ncbi:MAG: DUF1501 domain-containing protein [Verrucomicrobia bacterium]|jgi:hypothetical protein|nr:DUF1501 domain-containing protein [Verrucomicrobiota bacterium]
MNKPCNVDSEIKLSNGVLSPPMQTTRRGFIRNLAATTAGLTCADFLSYFKAYGLPNESKVDRLASGAAQANEDPRFLVYWFLEGGWCGYDMFNPVMTENNVIHRLDRISDERYRVLRWGEESYGIKQYGNIRYGYLAEKGRDLFKDMAVVSSMHTGTGHSRDRLKAHMGDYKFKQTEERQEDERSVMQAFAEVYGQPFVLPSLSWHWWLSDGELNEVQYSGRRGYYHALGPAHAHTIYAGTPAKLKKLLIRMQQDAGDQVARHIESFLDNAHSEFLKDQNIPAVKSYHSARQIYLQMSERGQSMDANMLNGLFNDRTLKEEFEIRPEDELITYRSVNGNKARSKFAPATNVQAMMSYEMMRAGLSCGFFIESRDVRRFDSHNSRKNLWKNKDRTPVGNKDQTTMMEQDLWDPLYAFVNRLKKSEYKDTGKSLFDHTNIVINSEFGRSLHGNVNGILDMDIPDKEKDQKIGGQDISAHWKVTSCAFMGAQVKGDRQYGTVGEKTLMAVPILPDGSMDPNYDPLSGKLKKGEQQHPKSFIPNHGDVYATALELSGIQSKGKGRNERPAMEFIGKA